MTGINIGGTIYVTDQVSGTTRYNHTAVGITDDGPRGDPGPTGATGPTGASGPAGAQGLAGASGASGPTGPSGASGATGASGASGASAYELWLEAGNTGTLEEFMATFEVMPSWFRYVQPVPQEVWYITHNLNRWPAVSVMDSAGSLVEGDVAYLSPSELTISFSAGFSGEAYLS